MTFASTFDNWQEIVPPPRMSRCSPNLVALMAYLSDHWPGLTSLGCFGVRPIRGGGPLSSHSFGAAIDVGFSTHMNPIIKDEVCPFLVARSDELHLQAVHDYRRARIWRAGRTPQLEDACTAWWKAQRHSGVTGMGQPWANHLHLEVTRQGWAIDTPILQRWDM